MSLQRYALFSHSLTSQIVFLTWTFNVTENPPNNPVGTFHYVVDVVPKTFILNIPVTDVMWCGPGIEGPGPRKPSCIDLTWIAVIVRCRVPSSRQHNSCNYHEYPSIRSSRLTKSLYDHELSCTTRGPR